MEKGKGEMESNCNIKNKSIILINTIKYYI